jgi:nicotinamide-nucleotide amidase
MENEPALSPFRVSMACRPNVVSLIPEGTEEDREAAWALLSSLFPGECLPPGVETLAEGVLGEAVASGRTLAAAESCTGGLIGGALTDIPGASASFLGTAVCYANGAKRDVLGVPGEILETDGAVSEACALAMAQGARALYGADLAVSVTGIAGPQGGTPRKPVGTVWFGLASLKGERSLVRCFRGMGREKVREWTVAVALEMLWKELRRREACL